MDLSICQNLHGPFGIVWGPDKHEPHVELGDVASTSCILNVGVHRTIIRTRRSWGSLIRTLRTLQANADRTMRMLRCHIWFAIQARASIVPDAHGGNGYRALACRRFIQQQTGRQCRLVGDLERARPVSGQMESGFSYLFLATSLTRMCLS